MSHKIIGINLFKFVLLFIIIKRTSGFMLHNVTKLSRERRDIPRRFELRWKHRGSVNTVDPPWLHGGFVPFYHPVYTVTTQCIHRDSTVALCDFTTVFPRCIHCPIIVETPCTHGGKATVEPRWIHRVITVVKWNIVSLGEADYYDDTLHCSNYQCQCKSNYTAISVAQCVQTHLLSSCNDVTKCSDSWHSFCSKERKCVCTLANIAVGTSMCLPILNGYCWKDDQCQVENSVCIDFLCKCKQSFIAIAANLCLPIN